MCEDCKNKITKEEEDMNAAVIERKGYNKLDLNKLNYSDKTVSSKEALHDVIPVQWSPEVLNGEKKAVIKKRG